ncbi:unnamed protein product [Phytophthora fragariaefolia]|uniref:Unnamed protein product n=1 Tax=Phytophthora fragariaefolia TaxID=1490495 RepID=A0A9W6XGC5_9STRA|nr:unnamed protein product [Phytophthora fragariaefolia]
MTPPRPGSGLSGGEEFAERLADISPLAVRKQVDTFLSTRQSVLRHVRDAMAESQDKQKEHADARGRNNLASYSVGDLVLLNAKHLPTHAVPAVFKTKLRPRYIRPFEVVVKKGLMYTRNLPQKMQTHPVFYVGLPKPYQDPARVRLEDLGSRASATRLEGEPSSQRAAPRGRSQDSDRVEPLAGRPAGQSDHDGSPIVPEELGPSPAAGAASPSHRNSDRHADERPGRELGAHSNSERTQSLRSTSPEASAEARRPPPALIDEEGNHHYHVKRILARRRCRGQKTVSGKMERLPSLGELVGV